jgi:hypothetical protein
VAGASPEADSFATHWRTARWLIEAIGTVPKAGSM